MSFAADLSPTDEMQGNVVTSLVLKFLIELVIFVASELFLRSFSIPNGGAQLKKLLILQAVILQLFSVFLYLFYHAPYLLLAISLMILIRVFWFKTGTAAAAMYDKATVKVSLPIGTGTRKTRSHSYNQHCGQEKDCQMNHASDEDQVSGNHHRDHIQTEPNSRKEIAGIKKANTLGTDMNLRRRLTERNAANVEEFNPSSEFDLSQGMAPVSHIDETQMETSSVSGTQMGNSMSSKEMPTIAPPGLVNRGNTCFMNSIIHCLAWTPKFSQLLHELSKKQALSGNQMHFIQCLSDVMSQCHLLPDRRSVFKSVSTDNLLTAISVLPQPIVSFSRGDQSQQDAAEFLLWLLNNLHSTWRNATVMSKGMDSTVTKARQRKLSDSINKWKMEISKIGSSDLKKLEGPIWNLSKEALELHSIEHSSLVNDAFMGQFLEVRQCRTCSRITTSSEYFTTLPLPVVDDSNTITDCIQRFSSTEMLAVENSIACECSPNGSAAERLTLLSIIPEILVLQLSRFSYDITNHSAVKNTKPVYFDVTLNIYPYTMQCKFKPISSNLLYSLQAVCIHSGGHWASSGHYVALVKASNDQWYYYNDDNVSEADITKELRSTFVLENAYLLFYSRC